MGEGSLPASLLVGPVSRFSPPARERAFTPVAACFASEKSARFCYCRARHLLLLLSLALAAGKTTWVIVLICALSVRSGACVLVVAQTLGSHGNSELSSFSVTAAIEMHIEWNIDVAIVLHSFVDHDVYVVKTRAS